MKTQEIRQVFTRFFEERAHIKVTSSSLVPQGDPTLLFTNAGMVQFKDTFLGLEKRDYSRATSIQKCVRAGGKHNDLENVGFTARHHTFFEMLGNFSFGDYFKKEAIHFAWDLLTKGFHLPPEKLWVTVFEEDEEAYDLWRHDIGVDPARISKIGAKDNFWMMGETGPCGPCTEIFYDHGPSIPGGPPGSPDAEGDRYIEIWNLVFMQYNRDANGTLTPLPRPSVDTGMGLERIAAVLQGVHDNYDIDIFSFLIKEAARITGTTDLTSRSLRVIADHIRSCSFLIADGVLPSNEGRGYVLRRIIRRAVRHGYKLGCTSAFFHALVPALTTMMGEAYSELIRDATKIMATLKQEEEQFARTLHQGMKLFDEAVSQLQNQIIPGDVIFKLYDTYGFPVDLTEDMAREKGLQLDHAGFEVMMNEQKQRAREHHKFAIDLSQLPNTNLNTLFLGYDTLTEHSDITALYYDNQSVDCLNAGEEGAIILSQSPFYAESGGQAGDMGVLYGPDAEFHVKRTLKQGQAIVHLGVLHTGELRVGTRVEANVDPLKRRYTARNHSATHLLHSALREILGPHVEQRGSMVNSDALRFDFVHPKGLSPEEREAVEALINEWISQDYLVEVKFMDLEAAQKMGAAALFGEKYGKTVRVLRMGDVSLELCGGTHVTHTGEIGLLKITSEAAIASGIRRIEALTSLTAKRYLDQEWQKAKTRVLQLEESLKELSKAQETLQLQNLTRDLPRQLLTTRQPAGKTAAIVQNLGAIEVKYLAPIAQATLAELGSGVVLLSAENAEKTSFVAAVSKDLASRCPAGELVKSFAESIGGKGGGKPELAQGGGPQVPDLAILLNDWIPILLARLAE